MTEKAKKEGRIKRFIRRHKVGIGIGAAAAATVLAYFGVRHRIKMKPNQISTLVETGTDLISATALDAAPTELPYKYLWENLSGEYLTPTKLGYKANTTARKINKLLVENGLQEPAYNGEYSLTDLGRKFGEWKWKVTASGHSFSNIEWDTRVLEILFPEEK